MTNVLVINGSPKMENSNTSAVITPLIVGMKKAGASVELIYTKKQKILSCTGCFSCWHETIGECIIKDNMQDIYPKLRKADILVLATPVHSILPGGMQNFINRLVPLIEPILECRDGRTRARCHEYVKIKKILAVVVGAWYEIENLELPVKLIEEVAETYSINYSGAILRPHAYFMRGDSEISKDIHQKLEEVGFKFIEEGLLKKEDLDFISQPIGNGKKQRENSTNHYLKRKEEQGLS